MGAIRPCFSHARGSGADANDYTHANAKGHCNAHTDANSHTDAQIIANRNVHTDANGYLHAHARTAAKGDAQPYHDTRARADAYSHALGDSIRIAPSAVQTQPDACRDTGSPDYSGRRSRRGGRPARRS